MLWYPLDAITIASSSNSGMVDGCYELDCSGVCYGDSVSDCSGECNGSATEDICGVCGGDDSSCS